MSSGSMRAGFGHGVVLDDDPLFLRALERALSGKHGEAGTRLSFVASVESALELVRARADIDLLVFDVCIPTVDRSRALLGALDELGRSLTLVAVSGRAERETVFELARLGVSCFLEKSRIARDPTILFRLSAAAGSSDPLDAIDSAARSLVGRVTLPDVKGRVAEAMYREALERGGSNASAAKLLGVHRQAVQNHKRRL